MTHQKLTDVVIVGGGFAGVACAKRLAGQSGVRAMIFDKNGFHQFQPLLYQVATAELTPEDVAFDLDDIFLEHDNVEAYTLEVTATDPRNHSVTLADGNTVAGDVLVLAAGAQPNFFRTPGAAEFGSRSTPWRTRRMSARGSSNCSRMSRTNQISWRPVH